MNLLSYLKSTKDGTEVTVWDSVYDMETYFYHDEDDFKRDDIWTQAMLKLAKTLEVVEFGTGGVIVNLSDLIEKHLPQLKKAKLFNYCDMDSIMENMDFYLAGYTTDKWLKKFVDILGD